MIKACPLYSEPIEQDGGTTLRSSYPCIENECAWWQDTTGECAILSIARTLFVSLKKGKMTLGNL